VHLLTVSATFDAPPAAVWAVVGDFGGLPAWSRAVQKCELEGSGVGCHRLLTTAAGQVRERLEVWDPEARRLAYSIVSGSSLPVRDTLAAISVTPLQAGGSQVDWRVDGEPLGDRAAITNQLRARYEARLGELREVLARKSHTGADA